MSDKAAELRKRAAQYKAAERERKRAAGLKRREIWATDDEWERIRTWIDHVMDGGDLVWEKDK